MYVMQLRSLKSASTFPEGSWDTSLNGILDPYSGLHNEFGLRAIECRGAEKFVGYNWSSGIHNILNRLDSTR